MACAAELDQADDAGGADVAGEPGTNLELVLRGKEEVK
jgi:hypothetical protein